MFVEGPVRRGADGEGATEAALVAELLVTPKYLPFTRTSKYSALFSLYSGPCHAPLFSDYQRQFVFGGGLTVNLVFHVKTQPLDTLIV